MLIDFIFLFKKYNIKPKGLLHVGASTGQEADIYDILNIPTVLWVEAIPEVYEKLKKHLEKYPKQIAINACIGDIDYEEVVFHVSDNEGQSSSYLELGLHKELHPTVHYIRDIKMTTRRLEYLNTAPIDFINLDIQGAELKALKGMGETLHNYKYAYVEVNQGFTYINCPLIGEIDEYLLKFGFKRVETYWATSIWGDAFYIKDDVEAVL